MNNFLYIKYQNNIHPKIIYKECKTWKSNETKIFKEYDDLKEKIKEERDKNDKLVLYEKKGEQLNKIDNIIFKEIIPYFQFNSTIYMNNLNHNIKKEKPLFEHKLEEYGKNKTHKYLHDFVIPTLIYQDFLKRKLKYCEMMDKMYIYKLKLIYYLFEYLEDDGNFSTNFYNCIDSNYIEFIYLCSLLFKKIVIFKQLNNFFVLCIGFENEKRVSKEEILKMITKKQFCIEPKPDLDLLKKFIINGVNEEYKIIKLLKNAKYNNYLNKIFAKNLNYYFDLSVDNNKIPLLIEKFSVEADKKQENILKDVINLFKKKKKKQISEIEKIIKEMTTKKQNTIKILEIGMGLGEYSKIILNKLKNNDFKLSIIDEGQHIFWKDVGIKNIDELTKNKKISNKIKIYEESPVLALPKILNEDSKSTYNLIFIHGFNTFDKMIYELIFIDILLRNDGYLIIDNTGYYHIKELINYIENNYKSYKKIENKNDLIIFKKHEDNYERRTQNYYSF